MPRPRPPFRLRPRATGNSTTHLLSPAGRFRRIGQREFWGTPAPARLRETLGPWISLKCARASLGRKPLPVRSTLERPPAFIRTLHLRADTKISHFRIRSHGRVHPRCPQRPCFRTFRAPSATPSQRERHQAPSKPVGVNSSPRGRLPVRGGPSFPVSPSGASSLPRSVPGATSASACCPHGVSPSGAWPLSLALSSTLSLPFWGAGTDSGRPGIGCSGASWTAGGSFRGSL